MQDITLKELQNLIDNFIQSSKPKYFSELTNLGQLTEEVGELARIFTRKFGDQKSKPDEDLSSEKLADEIADILFVLTCIANQTETNLTEAIQKNLDKKLNRDQKRYD